MKLFFIIILSIQLLYSYTLENVPVPNKYIFSNSQVCNEFPIQSSNDFNKFHNVIVTGKSYTTDNYWKNHQSWVLASSVNNFGGILCAPNESINGYWTGGERLVIFQGRNENEWIKVNLLSTGNAELNLPSCGLPEPEQTIINGLAYQGAVQNQEDCISMFNDDGDGISMQFFNPQIHAHCTTGYCYFNQEDSNGGNNNGGDTGNNNGGDTGNNGNGGNNGGVNTDDKYDVTQLIPYLDEIEPKNDAIADKLVQLDSSVNNSLSTIDNNMKKIDESMKKIDNRLKEEELKREKLKEFADDLYLDLSFEGDLITIKTTYMLHITETFAKYKDVFGFGEYGEAPAPISFNLMGQTFIVFDIHYISEYVAHIRQIFLVTAYIFGLYLVFKGD